MKSIDNILVALDLTSTDEHLIKYASFLAEELKPENIYFVHNIKKYEISDLFQEQINELNLEEAISEELEEKVNANFSANVATKVLISEDSYTESLINYIANKYAINLVILGNKAKKNGTGVVSDKLMRLLKCDIISVPENANRQLKNIWTGTDFSKASTKALSIAMYLKQHTNASITSVNIYNVPVQFTPYIEKEKMAPKIEQHIREKFDKFLKKYKFSEVHSKIMLRRDSSIADKLSKEAKNEKADLLVVADKGGNVFSSLLVGSVTDELFNRKLELPLWIVK